MHVKLNYLNIPQKGLTSNTMKAGSRIQIARIYEKKCRKWEQIQSTNEYTLHTLYNPFSNTTEDL